MQRLGEGQKEFWGVIISWAKKMEHLIVDPLANLQRTELRTFKVFVMKAPCKARTPNRSDSTGNTKSVGLGAAKVRHSASAICGSSKE